MIIIKNCVIYEKVLERILNEIFLIIYFKNFKILLYERWGKGYNFFLKVIFWIFNLI